MSNTVKVIFLHFILLVTSIACDNRTRSEYFMEELIPPQIKGVIEKTELWKGLHLAIYFNKSSRNADFGIINELDLIMELKNGDLFEKKVNSNKCYIHRKDSLLIFDCFDLKGLKYSVGDSLYETIEKWDRKIVDKWYAVSDTINVKTLLK